MKKEVKSILEADAIENSGLSPLLKKWLSGEDVCHLLGISKRTLQTYRDQRILPFAQIGRKIYFKASDVNSYLERHYIKASYQKGGVS